MVGNNGTMMAIRIVHSKLRKREEHSASVHPAEVLTPAPVPPAEPLTFRQQPLWQFPPPLPPPYVYPHDQRLARYQRSRDRLDPRRERVGYGTNAVSKCETNLNVGARPAPTRKSCRRRVVSYNTTAAQLVTLRPSFSRGGSDEAVRRVRAYPEFVLTKRHNLNATL
ncbi:hypothetical protein EVAR_29258_1 [Eumeta japonica]|uniref:Uncharacterized protein n=1 Tax=Eumeta variegata TaxID=151549 RepID=A0A4C1VKB9_EUMVA|nr:hypothetical protein EVAR_29258_1 [Eumeta japonica]